VKVPHARMRTPVANHLEQHSYQVAAVASPGVRKNLITSCNSPIEMSRRPSLSSFKLTSLQDLFGCGDAALENAVLRKLRKDYADNMPLRVRASELVHTVVHRGRSAAYPREEDETFQIVIDALAHHGQEHVPCTSIFWEQFFAEVDIKRISTAAPHLARTVRHLVGGRSLLGSDNASSWAYYAYLLDDEVVALRDFIRDTPTRGVVSEAFDVDGALSWLDMTCDAGRDVWCWVS
jgi:hypothetical protein